MVAAVLRVAHAGDVAHAARIIAAALAEHGLPFEPEGRDADVAMFGRRPDTDDLVAETAGTVVGVVSIGPHGDDGVAWVSKLFVDKAARGRGIGRTLLEAAHEAARRRGYAHVGLRTRRVFTEAIALYESAGYTRRGDPIAQEPGDVVYYRQL